MKRMCCVLVFSVVLVTKTAYAFLMNSNLSCNKPDPNVKGCSNHIDTVIKDLENDDEKLYQSILDSIDSTKGESHSEHHIDQIIEKKIEEIFCTRISEFIKDVENRKEAKITVTSGREGTRNSTSLTDLENDNSLSTSAIYLYGFLIYRLAFIFLQQM